MISTTATATTAINRRRKPMRKKRNGLFGAAEEAVPCGVVELSWGASEGTDA